MYKSRQDIKKRTYVRSWREFENWNKRSRISFQLLPIKFRFKVNNINIFTIYDCRFCFPRHLWRKIFCFVSRIRSIEMRIPNQHSRSRRKEEIRMTRSKTDMLILKFWLDLYWLCANKERSQMPCRTLIVYINSIDLSSCHLTKYESMQSR